jgi:hypothetical protein
MPHSIDPKRPTRSPRARLRTAAALVSVLLVGGCGGSSGSPPPPSTGVATSSASTFAAAGGAGSSDPTAASIVASGLAFARCMRSHGVPNFPDPKVTGHTVRMFGPNSGVNPRSPAFQSAQQACQGPLPKGPPAGGPPSPQARAAMLKVSECMRAHRISGFPDPTTSPPSNPAAYSTFTGNAGAFLAIPDSIDAQSPAFQQATAACNFGLHSGTQT